jgi:hypothetical protein
MKWIMKDTEEAKTFCFYSIKERADSTKNLFYYFEQMAEKFGYPWGALGITGKSKLLQFKTGIKKLEKMGFDELNSFDLLGGVDEPGTHLNWKINVGVNFDQYSRCIYFSYPADSSIDHQAFGRQLIKDVSQFSDFEYGIGFDRMYRRGPDMYCLGVISSMGRDRIPDDEEDQISCWSREYLRTDGDYTIGDLRDIYPYNMLTEPHLIRQVGSQTLKDWILSNPKHGTLEKVTDKHWLWSIDPEQIPMIQETLEPTGILLCYKPK